MSIIKIILFFAVLVFVYSLNPLVATASDEIKPVITLQGGCNQIRGTVTVEGQPDKTYFVDAVYFPVVTSSQTPTNGYPIADDKHYYQPSFTLDFPKEQVTPGYYRVRVRVKDYINSTDQIEISDWSEITINCENIGQEIDSIILTVSPIDDPTLIVTYPVDIENPEVNLDLFGPQTEPRDYNVRIKITYIDQSTRDISYVLHYNPNGPTSGLPAPTSTPSIEPGSGGPCLQFLGLSLGCNEEPSPSPEEGSQPEVTASPEENPAPEQSPSEAPTEGNTCPNFWDHYCPNQGCINAIFSCSSNEEPSPIASTTPNSCPYFWQTRCNTNGACLNPGETCPSVPSTPTNTSSYITVTNTNTIAPGCTNGFHTVEIGWTAVTGAANYGVYRGQAVLGNGPISANSPHSFVDYFATPGIQTYNVAAFNTGNVQIGTGQVTVNVPACQAGQGGPGFSGNAPLIAIDGIDVTHPTSNSYTVIARMHNQSNVCVSPGRGQVQAALTVAQIPDGSVVTPHLLTADTCNQLAQGGEQYATDPVTFTIPPGHTGTYTVKVCTNAGIGQPAGIYPNAINYPAASGGSGIGGQCIEKVLGTQGPACRTAGQSCSNTQLCCSGGGLSCHEGMCSTSSATGSTALFAVHGTASCDGTTPRIHFDFPFPAAQFYGIRADDNNTTGAELWFTLYPDPTQPQNVITGLPSASFDDPIKTPDGYISCNAAHQCRNIELDPFPDDDVTHYPFQRVIIDEKPIFGYSNVFNAPLASNTTYHYAFWTFRDSGGLTITTPDCDNPNAPTTVSNSSTIPDSELLQLKSTAAAHDETGVLEHTADTTLPTQTPIASSSNQPGPISNSCPLLNSFCQYTNSCQLSILPCNPPQSPSPSPSPRQKQLVSISVNDQEVFPQNSLGVDLNLNQNTAYLIKITYIDEQGLTQIATRSLVFQKTNPSPSIASLLEIPSPSLSLRPSTNPNESPAAQPSTPANIVDSTTDTCSFANITDGQGVPKGNIPFNISRNHYTDNTYLSFWFINSKYGTYQVTATGATSQNELVDFSQLFDNQGTVECRIQTEINGGQTLFTKRISVNINQ